MTCDPRELAANATCFNSCIPAGMAQSLRTYLLCQLENAPQGTPCDPDALAYIAAAGITNQTQIDAVCTLVADLKNNGTPSYWSREDIIYPLMSSTGVHASDYAQQRVNLKTPGTFNFTEGGATLPTYSALGIQGDGVTSLANTGYTIQAARLTNLRIMCYVDLAGTTTLKYYCGAQSAGPNVRTDIRRDTTVNRAFVFDANTAPSNYIAVGTTGILGSLFVQTRAVNQAEYSHPGSVALNLVAVVTAASPPNRPLFLLGSNSSGALDNPSNVRLSGFSLGSPFVSNAEVAQYKSIWDKFEAALGRGHPLGV